MNKEVKPSTGILQTIRKTGYAEYLAGESYAENSFAHAMRTAVNYGNRVRAESRMTEIAQLDPLYVNRYVTLGLVVSALLEVSGASTIKLDVGTVSSLSRTLYVPNFMRGLSITGSPRYVLCRNIILEVFGVGMEVYQNTLFFTNYAKIGRTGKAQNVSRIELLSALRFAVSAANASDLELVNQSTNTDTLEQE